MDGTTRPQRLHRSRSFMTGRKSHASRISAHQRSASPCSTHSCSRFLTPSGRRRTTSRPSQVVAREVRRTTAGASMPNSNGISRGSLGRRRQKPSRWTTKRDDHPGPASGTGVAASRSGLTCVAPGCSRPRPSCDGCRGGSSSLPDQNDGPERIQRRRLGPGSRRSPRVCTVR